MEIIGAIRHYLIPSAISAAVICGIWFLICHFISKKAILYEWSARFLLMTLVSAILILTDGYRVFTGDFTTMFMKPNLIPFVQTVEDIHQNAKGVIEQILYNLVLFLPFGFLLPLSFERIRWKWWKVVIITALTVAVVEILELFSGRYADIDDLFVNCIGALFGYCVCIEIRKFIVTVKGAKEHDEDMH